MSSVRVVAHAKVNLCLEVLGRRADGFHEVRSVMQSIGLDDELTLALAGTVSLECDVPALQGVDNLVVRAAGRLLESSGLARGARISLHKGIPLASGLGGASADAAAALVALNRLWGLHLPPSELESLAASLGSDVPFFLLGGTARVRGRGEVVEALPDAPPAWMVLLVPPHSLAAKTAELYRRLRPEHWSSGERTERLAETVSRGEQVGDEMLRNVFEAVADDVFPGMAAHREAMQRAGAPPVHLSGAGPALFSLFQAEAEARAVAARLAQAGYLPHVARTLTAAEARPQAISY